MKPSSSCEVVAILNTAAEINVVGDAIIAERAVNPDINQLTLVDRFHAQTYHVPVQCFFVYPGVIISDSQLKNNAEFAVTHDDEAFVLAAAKRVINESALHKRLRNKVTGRLQAARAITSFFNTPRQWRTW